MEHQHEQEESFSRRMSRMGTERLLVRLIEHHPEDAALLLRGVRREEDDADDARPLTKVLVQKVIINVPEPKAIPVPVKVIPLPAPVVPLSEPKRVALPTEPDEPRPTLTMIIREVADFYALTTEDVRSSCRQAFLIRPRHVAIFLCREMTLNTFPQIARQFNDRDHTSAMFAWRKTAACLGLQKGNYIEARSRKKFSEAFGVDERLKDEVDVIKLRLRERLLNRQPAA